MPTDPEKLRTFLQAADKEGVGEFVREKAKKRKELDQELLTEQQYATWEPTAEQLKTIGKTREQYLTDITPDPLTSKMAIHKKILDAEATKAASDIPKSSEVSMWRKIVDQIAENNASWFGYKSAPGANRSEMIALKAAEHAASGEYTPEAIRAFIENEIKRKDAGGSQQ